jgi:hypothetical protein
MKSAFESMKSDIQDTLERYSKEASSAKGTEYSSIFIESERKVKDLLKETEKSLSQDPRIFSMKIEGLNKSRLRMELTLSSLGNESRAKLSLVQSLYNQSGMEGKKAADISGKIAAMRGMVAAGEHVNALRAGTAISKELDSFEPEEDNGLILLGVTALAVLAIIGAYMMRQQKEPKVLKKLEKAKPGDSFSCENTDQRQSSEP